MQILVAAAQLFGKLVIYIVSGVSQVPMRVPERSGSFGTNGVNVRGP